MGASDPRLDHFYAQAGPWAEELTALRRVLLSTPLQEDWKWRQPCYTYAGANVAIVGALKDRCVVSFLKGVLLPDPLGLLVAPGANSRSARYLSFASVAQISDDIITTYVADAIAVEQSGAKVLLAQDDLAYPEELTDALEADADLAAAWEALTPGRRRGYVLHIAGAKQSATRSARIDKHRPRILQGLGLHDR